MTYSKTAFTAPSKLLIPTCLEILMDATLTNLVYIYIICTTDKYDNNFFQYLRLFSILHRFHAKLGRFNAEPPSIIEVMLQGVVSG